MEEETKKSSSDSLIELFNDYPFIMGSSIFQLTQKDIYKIYQNSNHFSKNLEKYEINKEEYKVIFEDKVNYKIIKFYKKNILIKCLNRILKTPYIIQFEYIDEYKEQNMYIFKEEAYTKLSIFLEETKDKYEIIKKPNEKTLLIKNKTLKISEEIYTATMEKNNILNELEDFKEKTIKINLKFLSSNYDSLFTKIQKDNFIFILNEERINFFNKLNEFINSEKLFYYITGSDGIGKSLSLLYYSSLSKHKFLYFNIKSYFKENNDGKFRYLFYNDIQKLFLSQYPEDNKEDINDEYNSYIKSLEKYLKSDYYNNLKDIGKIFKYILCFLKAYPIYNYIIILDQYKSDLSDPNNIGLNSIIKFIFNHNDTCKIKLIISSSVDNTSNKYILLRNLSKIYLNISQTDLSKLLFDESLDNINICNNENIISQRIEFTEKDDILDNKDDCLFCENIFKREKAKREEELLKNGKNNYYIVDSNCLIDQYPEYTIKDYYFALSDGKKIFQNNLNERELIMAEMFNFNLKYINKYMDLKNKTEQNLEENDDDYKKRVIQLFYKQISDKMKAKIGTFYETLFKTNNKDSQYSNYIHMEFQSLCKLRNYIFYEKKFIISDLAQQLLHFPMKYLQIVINDYDKSYFPQDAMELNYSFKLEYNNDFTRIIINRIIEELYNNITNIKINSFRGSAEGTYLEIKIDELFRKNCAFDLNNLESRYLFSLVSKTDNSEDTVKKHREEEIKLLFFGNDNYISILIDDIDIDKIKKFKKDHYILNKNYYYFSQVSLTGKTFDMCVIVKEKDNVYKLYLFQVSKNKTVELGTNMFYLKQADDVAQNLEKLYNINITERHLIFVLPKINYDSKFKETLKESGFCYIFFDIYTSEFYNNKFEIINHFDFPGSLLDINIMTDYKKINNNVITWQNSMKAFINKKRNNKKSFYDIYINEFYSTNLNRLIKLNLKQINSLILQQIINDKNAILKFIGNCDISNKEKVRNIYRMIFIFKRDNKIYIDYQTIIYLLKRVKFNYELIKIENKEKEIGSTELQLDETLLKTISSNQSRYTQIQLGDLFDKNTNKYDNKCFCYLVITEQVLTEFYKWWC